MSSSPQIRRVGRGSALQPDNPHLSVQRAADLEQVAADDEYLDGLSRPATQYLDDHSRSIVSENNSPDINFRWSVNPYRGCAHGCSYCYARPTHEYLGFTAGLDFETKVLVKRDAPRLLRQWLARPQWQPEMIALSGVTDCYQPIERELQLTRQCLQVLAECRQPTGIVTKNALVARDLDLLRELAAVDAVRVAVSVTSLDQSLTRDLEPRTSSPAARLRAIEQLAAAGVPTEVMVAPVIPGLNDSELPAILAAARDAGARRAGYLLLRMPTTVQPVFLEWLARCRPNHAAKVESFVRDMRGGRLNSANFGERHRGQGPLAEQIGQTFRVFAKKLGLAEQLPPLNAAAFRPPRVPGAQQSLF
ncbi:MAG: radical SAM protein [Planctomycetaceae bacterium]|nr:radical SAM protein [Planctomycetaceae bacterium]